MANPNFVPSFSTNEIFRDIDNTRCLTDDLDAIETGLSGKADSTHTHDSYAESTHTHSASDVGAAPAVHTHTGYAESNHTHSEYASATHEHTGYAETNHTHTGYASSDHNHDSDYADIDHTHTGFASSSHDHDSDYAPVSHSHSGYASSDHNHDSAYAAAGHSHSGYAASSHNHDSDYLSTDGGTVNGDVNVAGVIRANGQQAFYYNTTSASQTIGTNNATGGTTIGCNANANTTINGANVKTKNVIPQASNTHALGTTSLRWKNIYANNAVNVSSDERLKRDIGSMDNAELAAFINKLHIVSYNYNDDPVEAKSRIGLLAQEVQSADTELAKFFVEEGEDGMLGMTPANLVFALIAAVQELKQEIDELKAAR